MAFYSESLNSGWSPCLCLFSTIISNIECSEAIRHHNSVVIEGRPPPNRAISVSSQPPLKGQQAAVTVVQLENAR